MSNKFEDWDSVDLDENVEEMVDEVVLKAFENPSLEDLEQQYTNGNYSYSNVQNNNSYSNEDEEDGVIENNEPEPVDPRVLQWPNGDMGEPQKPSFNLEKIKSALPFIIIAVLIFATLLCIAMARFTGRVDPSDVCVSHVDRNNDKYCDRCAMLLEEIPVEIHTHSYAHATCTEAATCACGETYGQALGHTWTTATCIEMGTCLMCGITNGEYGAHTYIGGDCETYAQCIYCGNKSFENYGHDWQRNSCEEYQICSKCNKTGGAPIAHQYVNEVCRICGAIMPPPITHQHEYDNVCDDTCNICGAFKEGGGHLYASSCDTECNVCGEVRVTLYEHYFDNEDDTICNGCGYIREIEHIHNFVNGQCECGASNLPEAVDPEIEEMLANLEELFSMMPQNYKLYNIQMNDVMKSLGLMPEYYEVVVDGNNRLVKNNETNWQYTLSLEDGVYTIITEDGEVIDISLEINTPDMGLGDTGEMPEITGDDIYYDEERGVYVISSELLLYALFSNMDMENDDTIYIAFLLSMLLSDAEHTLKVEQGFIPSITVTSTLQTGFEILNLNVKPSFTGVTANIILNLSPLFNGTDDMIITTNLTYTIIDNDNGKLSVIVSMPDENGTIDATYSSDVRINQDPIVITTQMQEAIEGLNSDIDTIIQKKYPGYQFSELDDCDCDYATIYDEELDLYITFNLSFKVNGHAFVDHYSQTLNSVEHCYVTLDEDGNLVSVKHALDETITDIIIEKYQGEFSCTNFCGGEIVVYDEEYGVYVVFDRDFRNEDIFVVEDFLTTVKAAPAADECVAQIDFDAKTLTIVEHSDACEYCNSLVGIEFTAFGFDDCDCLVVDIGNDCFMKFEECNNGKFVIVDFGCVIFWNSCECTIDIDNATLTVIEHDH